MNSGNKRPGLTTAALLAVLLMRGVATGQAAPLEVAGSPGWTPSAGGYKVNGFQNVPGNLPVNNFGFAVWHSVKYNASGVYLGSRAVRWDATGLNATELSALGTSSSGYTDVYVSAIDSSGTAVGFSDKYDASGGNLGSRAVRWDASGTAVTELGNLGTDINGFTYVGANALNASGTIVGFSSKFDASGNYFGDRAVRWDASGTIATELGTLGTSPSGYTLASARVVNDAGTIAGSCEKYDSSGGYLSMNAVRWDASGITATELGNLGISVNGYTFAIVYAINQAGTCVGNSAKYNASGIELGNRAVRWDASGTTATELGTLGTDTSGRTSAAAYDVNDVGTAVGYSNKYNAAGGTLGQRAVRWGVSGSLATELANLGTSTSGFTFAEAYAVNDAGTAVGVSSKYSPSGSSLGLSAVAWLPDASVIDLNTLGILNNMNDAWGPGTWSLATANSLTEDGYIAGTGTFTPANGNPAYIRNWVAQLGLGGDWLNTTNVNNTWGKGRNWSTGTPAIQLDANFNAPGSYTVAFDDDESARNVTVSNGHVTFSLGSHALQVDDTLTVSQGATLELEGVGVITAEHLQLVGVLDVTGLQDDLASAPGSKMLIDAQTRTGVFSRINGVAINATQAVAITYAGADVLAQIATPGDADLNGLVDVLDAATLVVNFNGRDQTIPGVGASWAVGDFDGDADVDFFDAMALRINLQFTADDLAAIGLSADEVSALDFAGWSSAVTAAAEHRNTLPEPATAILIISAIGLCGRRRGCC